MTVLINHVGYRPEDAKYCMIGRYATTEFTVMNRATGEVVHTGRMIPDRDPTMYAVGEFTAVTTPGEYEVQAVGEKSFPCVIGEGVYDDALRKMVRYFAMQRCGPTSTGYHSPCHLDDGRRWDNGAYQDVSGGWHDANDLRKWVSATIFGMIGLARVAELHCPDLDRSAILEELQWGNRYFLHMQEPAGYVMSHCGGDMFIHSDNNRWTANKVGDADGRCIDTRPCVPFAQFCFILAQAATARLAQSAEASYAEVCREAALRCLKWCVENKVCVEAGDYGAAVAACVELYRTWGEETHLDLAADYARELLVLQVRNELGRGNGASGLFVTSRQSMDPFIPNWRGYWPLLGLCALIDAVPDHPEASGWREGIRAFCEDHLAPVCGLSAFGIAPYGLFLANPGGGRQVGGPLGGYWYRTFPVPGNHWWVGINGNLASAGVGLAQAAHVLDSTRLRALAQRQLDWIVGLNPYNASTIMAVGHNNPQHMIWGGFEPPTPYIPGAVMCGIGGTPDDRAYLDPGSYQTCEYWTPMVCHTMWLMAELSWFGKS